MKIESLELISENDSPLMQEVDRHTVENLREVIKALERDKTILAKELQLANNQTETLKFNLSTLENLVKTGNKIEYCAACGSYYEQFTKCDCIPGVDYD